MNWFRKKEKPKIEIVKELVDSHLQDTPVEVRLIIKDSDYLVEVRWKPVQEFDSETSLLIAKVIIQLVTNVFNIKYIEAVKEAAVKYGKLHYQTHVSDLIVIGLSHYLKVNSKTEPIVSPLNAFKREN